MPRLTIDNREVEVDNGATILDAAAKLGIEIPTMCFLKEYKASTSCMVCVVKVEGMANLTPACGTLAQDGMRIETNSEQVRQARKVALELLLSDHLGDCLGPCHVICPAKMNIPLMIRQIAAGKLRQAIATVKKDIALPAVLGRICPAPCEMGCRWAVVSGSVVSGSDPAVSICLLKRYVADVDLQSKESYLPTCKPKQNKRIAIVGAGPAGLAAGYYLQQEGFSCTIFDDQEKPGGMLRYGVSRQELPEDVLDKEIAIINRLGVEFKCRTKISSTLSLEQLRRDFNAVFVAVGADAESMGLKTSLNGIEIDSKTYQTNLPDVFAGGDAVRKRKLTVRAVADGKEAAVSIGQFLSGQAVTGVTKPFNTRIGKIKDEEKEKFLTSGSSVPRTVPSEKGGGFTEQEAREEAERCLHCDCRKPDECKLRRYAHDYEAKPNRYKSQRRTFVQYTSHPEVIYEPGKCIDCGLCIEIVSKAGEELGLTFINRGFDVRMAVPFDRPLAEGLKKAAAKCVAACPTGALALKHED
jgi:NADPH-dependent glutamate synthase beta subunit-like oxidoreductase